LLLHDVLDSFDTVVYGNDVARMKPDPEPYVLAMKRLGVTNALVIEDSDSGVASADAAGCAVLRVSGPAEVRGALRKVLGDFR
jgi:HAD superfamily hydrolase (TIGR01509 family)